VSDDDWIAPHTVETLAAALEDKDVVFGSMVIVNPQAVRVVELGGAVMWRRSLTDEIGGFDPRWSYAGDTDLYGRFSYSEARIGYVREPLYFQTEHAQHGAYLYRDELAAELKQIHDLYPDAVRKMSAVVRTA